jgi:hypothetical protein
LFVLLLMNTPGPGNPLMPRPRIVTSDEATSKPAADPMIVPGASSAVVPSDCFMNRPLMLIIGAMEAAPGCDNPSMITGCVTSGSAVCGAIVCTHAPGIANVIVSRSGNALAAVNALRNEPAPLSDALVTTNGLGDVSPLTTTPKVPSSR